MLDLRVVKEVPLKVLEGDNEGHISYFDKTSVFVSIPSLKFSLVWIVSWKQLQSYVQKSVFCVKSSKTTTKEIKFNDKGFVNLVTYRRIGTFCDFWAIEIFDGKDHMLFSWYSHTSDLLPSIVWSLVLPKCKQKNPETLLNII